MTTMAKPLVLLVGTGSKDYRQYLLDAISPYYRLHLLSPNEPTWEAPYLFGWTATPDLTDEQAMAATAKGLDGVDGVLCWDEAYVLPVARLAAALGLPGGGPDAVAACRDKHGTRRLLAAAGVPQPASIPVANVDEALAAAERIGYPVVLKPRALAASLGVVRVDDPEQLAAQFTFAHDTTVPGAPSYDVSVLVEQFADGPEISVDAVVYRGTVTPMVLARKLLGYPPYFEEVGHLVDGADPLLADERLRQILRDAHAALGFADGVTHTELRLTPTGPMVIEVNARLGGDLIPYLGMLATGVDPGLAAAAVACGTPPEVAADRARVAGVRYFYADADDTVIDTVHFAEGDLPADVDRLVALAKPGAVVSPPPKGATFGRVAVATAVASTRGRCEAALDVAAAALRITPRRAA
jgi:biotin carboxylase